MVVAMRHTSSSKWWRVVPVHPELFYESGGWLVVCPGWSLVSPGRSSVGLHPGYRGGTSK